MNITLRACLIIVVAALAQGSYAIEAEAPYDLSMLKWGDPMSVVSNAMPLLTKQQNKGHFTLRGDGIRWHRVVYDAHLFFYKGDRLSSILFQIQNNEATTLVSDFDALTRTLNQLYGPADYQDLRDNGYRRYEWYLTSTQIKAALIPALHGSHREHALLSYTPPKPNGE